MALVFTESPTEDQTELERDGSAGSVSAQAVETAPHVLRARRTAASTRATLGLAGIGLLLLEGGLLERPLLGVLGFSVIAASALVQLSAPRLSWLRAEESLAGIAAILIVGLGDERVTVVSLMWLAAVASGVMARGGRVHWIGRTVVLTALALPLVRLGEVRLDYAALCLSSLGLLLTSGRLTRELNHLLTQARYDADHDDLTGTLSSAAFRTRLQRATDGAGPRHPVSVLLLDLDGFGMVNKTLGHAAGDTLLATVGERLRLTAGPRASVGRLGGDEFAVIVGEADPETVAQELLDTLATCGAGGRVVSASIGIAVAPRDGSDAEALLRAGDIARRVAKRSDVSGRISRYAGESLSGLGSRSARHSLSRLIEGDGLSMAVQPIVDLRTMTMHGYEALARFDRGGAQSPLHWFSLAEEFGERDELERACLRAALDLYVSRPEGCRLSVNLSSPVLLEGQTLRILEQIRDLSGLIIEVTEETLVQSDTELQAALAPLRARGARLAVDDMGAGYSGLRQITTVHPSYLKLDRSLVSGIDGDDDRAALVGALVGYAEHVGSLLVAEGIETPSELRTLIGLGVPLAQGFYTGRPGAPWPSISEPALQTSAETAAAPRTPTPLREHEPARAPTPAPRAISV